ncbi:MAG: outer membrane protein, partial [Methylocystis sp.]
GYLITPTLLAYGTGGLAYGGAYANIYSNGLMLGYQAGTLRSTQQFSGQGRSSDTLIGYSAGGGFEWMTSANWSLKAEALYYNLGNMNVSTSSYSPSTYYASGVTKVPSSGQISTAGNTSLGFQGLIARAGINYHFNPIDQNSISSLAGIFPVIEHSKNKDVDTAATNFGWDGFYLGMNAGYGFGTNNSTVASNDNIIDPWTGSMVYFNSGVKRSAETTAGTASVLSGIFGMKQGGFVGGGQAGFNYRLMKNYILGLETDIQGTSIRGSNASSGFGYSEADSTLLSRFEEVYHANSGGYTSVRAGLNYLGTVRGRAGYLWAPNFMTFATAGLSYGGAYANVNTLATTLYSGAASLILNGRSGYLGGQQLYGSSSYTDTLVGYNVGGGFELALTQNWSIKTEALYYYLGNMNVRTNSFAPAIHGSNNNIGNTSVPARWITGNTSVNYQGIIARAGLNYHFNLGTSPVVAKF